MRARSCIALTMAALIMGQIMVGCGDDDNPADSSGQPEHLSFAGKDGGVYLSPDGVDWTATSFTDTVYSLVTTSGEIYAGTNDGRGFRSSDRGNTWTSFSDGLTDREEIYALVVTPQGDILAGLDNAGVFRSAPGSESWSSTNDGLPSDDCDARSLIIAPDGTILLGSQCGAFSSVDGGESWQPTGFLDEVDRLEVNEQGHIYIGTEHDGIQRSTDDGGATWMQVMALDTMIMSFPFNPTGYVFAGSEGIARSEDGGNT